MKFPKLPAPRRSTDSLRQPESWRIPHTTGFVAILYGVLGLLFTLSSFIRSHTTSFRVALENGFFPLPHSTALSVLIIALGFALYGGKRAGWRIAVTLVVIFVLDKILLIALGPEITGVKEPVAHWIIIGGFVQVAILALLLGTRRYYKARVTGGAIGRALLVWALGTTGVVAIGIALVTAFPHTLIEEDRYGWVVNHVVLFSLVNPSVFSGRPATWLIVLLSLMATAVLIAALYVLIRSQRMRNQLSAADEQAVRTMIRLYNPEDSLGYFATRRDKAICYAPSGLAAVSFRVEVGVCLASGDPIGDPNQWDAAVKSWARLAREYGWVPAVMGASEAGARVYERHGLQSIHLGDEAVVYTEDVRLSAPEYRQFRQAVVHAQRHGVWVRARRHSELTSEEMELVQRRADEWRDTTEERGFSMALGRLGDEADGDCVLVEALIGTDRPRVVAQLSFAPWGSQGLSLDLMRRAPEAPNGTVEAMVAHLCTDEDLTIQRLSLNFAVFRHVFASEDKVGQTRAQRTRRRMLVFLSRWWQMESLYRNNTKYNPRWFPRYMCFPSSFSIAQVGVAAGIAEGFLPAPIAVNTRRNAPNPSGYALRALDALQHAESRLTSQPRRISEQSRVRIDKVDTLRAHGIEPWPTAFTVTHHCQDVLNATATASASSATASSSTASTSLSDASSVMTISGRVMARRDFGGVVFLDVQDFGARCQVLLERPERRAGEPDVADFIDLGDLIVATGTPGFSRTGTPSLLADTIGLQAKSLHPLPDKRRGLVDPEARVRARHVDMAVNAEGREALAARSAILHTFRSILHDRGYLEVETPILQRVHGGANARPFETHINAYALDLFLRIAPELYLKRLMCGGAEKVFELGRVFRNEGVDATHNPEFTVLEAYEAQGDYTTMRLLTQELIQAAARAVHGREAVPGPDGQWVDISGEWPVVTFYDAISTAASVDLNRDVVVDAQSTREELQELCDDLGVDYRATWEAGDIALELYEHLVEDRTTAPTFYCDFPTDVSPLTRKHRSVPGVAERWDLVAWGVELGTAYTELTDPLDQRERLEEQSLLAAGGDPEAMEVDEDFLNALEFGMPPTGGLGIGVDRVIMLVTGRTIREVLAFPLVKPSSA